MPDFAIVNLAAGQSLTMAPLGALYVVAALEEAGYSVAFRDYALERGPDIYRTARIADFLDRTDSPILGISCFSSMLPHALAASRTVRAARPDIKIVLGGPGPSAIAKDLMQRFPEIDFVVYGEGEETAIELAAALLTGSPALSSIQGLVWRGDDGTVVQNPARQRRKQLDEIRFPAYELSDLAWYGVVGVVYARGCPYQCTYCDVVSMWKRLNVARTLENVLTELNWLEQEYGLRHVAFVDDLFTVDRARTIEFCRAVRAPAPGFDVGLHDTDRPRRRRPDCGYGGRRMQLRLLRCGIRIRQGPRARQQDHSLRQDDRCGEIVSSGAHVCSYPVDVGISLRGPL